MYPLLTAWLSLSLSAPLKADDSWPSLQTTDGKIFTNAKLSKIEPDGIRIVHEDGIAKLPYEHLPESLREELNFDERQAAAFRQASDQKQQQALKTGEHLRRILYEKEVELRRLQDLTYFHMSLEVYKILPDGLICVPRGGLAAHARKQTQLQAASGSAIPLPESLPDQAFWVTRAGDGWAEGDLLRAYLARAGAQQINERTLPWLACKN